MLHWVASVPLCFVTKTMMDTVKTDLPWDGSLSVALFRFFISYLEIGSYCVRTLWIPCICMYKVCIRHTVYALHGNGHLEALWQAAVAARMWRSSHLRKLTLPQLASHMYTTSHSQEKENKRQSPLHSLNKQAQPESLCLADVPQTGKNIEPFLRPHKLTPTWGLVYED